jgi:alginate O-acetyltransferase complex protein AlgI
MLFNSFEYFIFFMVVIPLYYLLKSQMQRVLVLLVASCVFYMYFIPQFILILFAVILIDYSTGIAIAKESSARKKKLFLLISVCSNLLILFFFKYFNFFVENIELLSGSQLFRLNIILPIGLSFHTFQSLSYVVEVYRGKTPAEKNINIFALYVMFFPQLVAGPIERPQNIIYQLKEKKKFDISNLIKGVRLISIGLIKKSVLADRLSIYVDDVFSNVQDSSPFMMVVAVIFFAFQIYFDFSGYSDIAIGSARCLGINLMLNFNVPYLSHSLKEFWTRWHISLSTWFKDYVFIPLGGSRVSKLKHFRNIMIVFALSGLWHGASWNFVFWGLLHGLLVYFSYFANWSFKKWNTHLSFMDVIYNFIVVTLLWIFFRSPDLETTKLVFVKLIQLSFSDLSFSRINFGFFSLMIVVLSFLYLNYLRMQEVRYHDVLKTNASWLQLIFNFILILVFGIFSSQSFIYFQF